MHSALKGYNEWAQNHPNLFNKTKILRNKTIESSVVKRVILSGKKISRICLVKQKFLETKLCAQCFKGLQ